MGTSTSIAIVGSGAIGLYYGTRLALAGLGVRFLMRSDLAHVREHGTRIIEKSQTLTLKPAAAFGSTAEIGAVDVVLITLKTTVNHELPRMLPPLIGEDTIVATLQNGLGNEEKVAAIVGAERTLGGLCFIATNRTGPGEVTCFHPGSVAIGVYRPGGPQADALRRAGACAAPSMDDPAVRKRTPYIGRPADERAGELSTLFQTAGVKCSAVDDLAAARWRKLVWNVPFNGLSIAAGGFTTDRILADPALASEVRALMDEIANAARCFGYEIPEKFIQNQIDVTGPMGPYKPSSLIDFLAGREVEVEAIWGEPLRRAQAVGARVPRLAHLYGRLKQLTAREKSE